MSEARPCLAAVCEDTFLFLTSFRRMAGRSEMKSDELRARLKGIFREQWKQAEAYPDLYELYQKAHYLLAVASDGIIRTSDWEHAEEWWLLEEEEFGTAAGGQRFFQLLEDPAYKHGELREVFFLCLSVGFEGEYLGKTIELAEIRNRVYHSLARRITDPEAGFTPEARQEVLGEEPAELAEVRMLRFVAVLVGVMIFFGLLSHYSYSYRVKDIDKIAGAIAYLDGQDGVGGR